MCMDVGVNVYGCRCEDILCGCEDILVVGEKASN